MAVCVFLNVDNENRIGYRSALYLRSPIVVGTGWYGKNSQFVVVYISPSGALECL